MENDGAALASTVMAGRVLREGRDGKLSTDLHRADEGDGEKGKINLMDESHFKSSINSSLDRFACCRIDNKTPFGMSFLFGTITSSFLPFSSILKRAVWLPFPLFGA